MNAVANPATDVGWLSVADAARYAGVGVTTIREAINDPTYPTPLIAHRVGRAGGKIRIERAELDAWMRSHGGA